MKCTLLSILKITMDVFILVYLQNGSKLRHLESMNYQKNNAS